MAPQIISPFDPTARTRLRRMGLLTVEDQVNTNAIETISTLQAGLLFSQILDSCGDWEGTLSVCRRITAQAAQIKDRQILLLISIQYGSTGVQVAEGYTDASGRVSFPNLARGQYVYQEFKAPKGYLLDENRYSVSLTENGATITETRTNERRPGTLIVQKRDAGGSLLAGAAFLLEYSSDDGSTWQPVFYRVGDELTRGGCTTLGLEGGQLTTGADGKAIFTGLRADGIVRYRLTETKAPPGMSLLADSVLVGTLPIESDNINAEDSEVFDDKAFHYTLEITATNAWQYRLPETGGDDSLKLLPFAMMFLAAPMIFTIKSKSKKENN